MSERDLQRIEVLSKVIAGRMTLVSAAHVLELSTRQVRRLLERIEMSGAASIRHKATGRPSNNRISDGVRDYAVTLVRERYVDFGPTLAPEKLAERDGLTVSRQTSAASWPVGRNPAETITLKRCSADHAPIATIDLDLVTSASSDKSICVDLILAAYSFDLSKTEVLKITLAAIAGNRLRPR